MAVELAFADALRSQHPIERLRGLALSRLGSGESKSAVLAAFDEVREEPRNLDREADEHVVLDVMDQIDGFGSPHRAIIREAVARPSSAWIHRMSRSDRYPDPIDEVRGLAEVSARGEQAFLLLSDRPHPPLSGRLVRRGDPIYLCISEAEPSGRHLLALARARLGTSHQGSTPASVEAIYGELHDRQFREVVALTMFEPTPIEARALGFSEEDEARLLAGQAHAAEFQPVDLPGSVSDEECPPERLLGRVYDGLTEQEIDEVESIILARGRDQVGAAR